MTQLLVAGGLGQAFKSSTQTAAYLKLFARQQEEARVSRERKEELRDDTADLMDFAMVAVSDAEISEFRLELEQYDTATIAALQQNETELNLSRERLEKLFGEAYVLPDGRRVFKTQDGEHVFDEHGQEVPEDVIRAGEIEDFRPKWEDAQPEIEHHKTLLQERTELLEYQNKLDDARERLDTGDMSRKEFDALRDELKADMPEAVRAHVPGMEAKPEREANAFQAEELDITDDMMPSSPAAKAFIPAFNG